MYIFPHKTEWKSEFLKESNSILKAYGRGISLHHIGSTAVEGLYAKDCIDILGVVDNLTDVSCKVSGLSDIGFIHKGSYGIEGREYFSKNQRKVHLHIFEVGDINIAKHLNFIQVMSDSLKLVSELNQIKLALHDKYPNNKELYQKEKESFYNEIHKML